MRRLFVGLVVVTVLAAGPTMIPLGILAAPAVPNGGVMTVTPNGQVVVATLGAGVSLVNNNGAWSLVAAQPREVLSIKPALQQNGTYVLPDAAIPGTLRVYRNGVRQSPGDDYAYDQPSKTISPVAASPWNQNGFTDLVLCDYTF